MRPGRKKRAALQEQSGSSVGGDFGEIFHFDFQCLRGGAELGADNVGGKTGAQQIAVERGAFLFVERRTELAQAALDARVHQCGLVGFREDGFERCVNVLVLNAADAQFACDAEFSLPPMLRVDASIVPRVSRVVEVLHFFQPLYHFANVLLMFGAAREICAHFVHGIRAAHKAPQGGGVKFRFSGMFSRRGAHRRSIEGLRRGGKETGRKSEKQIPRLRQTTPNLGMTE